MNSPRHSSSGSPDQDSIVQVVGDIAHDLNNVLTVISGNLALAERHAAGNPKLIRLLNNIRLAFERGSDLTDRLTSISIDVETKALPGEKPVPGMAHQLRILVVEDDADVAEVAVAVLENMGHIAELRADADSALVLLRQAPRYDLVFSDIMMPGTMNGIDLAEAIAREFPGLPVLLATGYSNAALAPGALRFPVLAKPYSVQELSRRVGQMISPAQA